VLKTATAARFVSPPQYLTIAMGCDMKPKIELDDKKIELLLRSALLDDATNVGERLGALLADISVDDDGDALITFEEDYWPEEKEPTEAMSVASVLGIELQLEVGSGTPPFHWPRIAEELSSTAEYVSVLLDAYAGRKLDFRRQ